VKHSESLLREAGNRSEYLRPREFVALAERYAEGTDAGTDPGVPREWLLAHVEALDGESHVDAESFRSSLSEVTTDAETWADDRAVYEVGEDGDRLSAYPPAWHEALGGVTSLPEVVRYLLDGSDYRPVDAGAGDGVPEDDLLDIAAAVGGFTREAAKAALEECRADGRLVEDVDQHPEANVYLPRSEHEQDARPE
jgi:hypothetical protein